MNYGWGVPVERGAIGRTVPTVGDAGDWATCLKRSRTLIPAMVKPSTARPPKRTVRRLADKAPEARAISRSLSLAPRKSTSSSTSPDEVTPGQFGEVRCTWHGQRHPSRASPDRRPGYDSKGPPRFLLDRRTVPVIPTVPSVRRARRPDLRSHRADPFA